MPHLRLEYSSNLDPQEKESIPELFLSIHHLLAEKLPTNVLRCKSRAVECNTYTLGDGQTPHAFIHGELKIKKGRTKAVVDAVGEAVLAQLQQHFLQSAKQMELDFSLEIITLSDEGGYYSG